MKVRVKAFARFRDLAGAETSIDLEEGSTAVDLLETVFSSHPDLKEALLDPDGKVGEGVKILINRRGIDPSDPTDAVLEDGDEVALLPPFSGG
ncbi:MAG: ubiquitin-like small modifier protein 1 [Methanothrix sp.]